MNKPPVSFRIRNKIFFAFLAVVILPLVMATLWYYLRVEQMTYNNMVVSLRNSLMQVHDNMTDMMKNISVARYVLIMNQGGTLQNTPSGPIDLPFENFQCVTNHLVDDEAFFRLYDSMGIVECAPGPNTGSRIRRGYVMSYIRELQGKLTSEELVRFLGEQDDSIPDMSVNNGHTIAVGYNEPKKYKNSIWFLQPQLITNPDTFLRFDI